MGRGQGSNAEEEAHHAENAARHLKPFYIRPVATCWAMRMKEILSDYIRPAWNNEPVTGDDAKQTDAHKKNNLQSCKEAKLRHLRPSVFNAYVLLTCLCLGFFQFRYVIHELGASQYRRRETLALQFLHATHGIFMNCSMKVEPLYSLHRMGESIPW